MKFKPESSIADAILKDSQVVQHVARYDSDALEMDKVWEFMSELEKDELLKKMIRECNYRAVRKLFLL